MTGRSGTQRARPAFSRGDCPHRAGDGPRPVRAGSAWPLVSDRRGCRGLRRSRGGSRRCFLRSGFERIFGCPLTVEGHPRTLSGPSPDRSPARTLAFPPVGGRVISLPLALSAWKLCCIPARLAARLTLPVWLLPQLGLWDPPAAAALRSAILCASASHGPLRRCRRRHVLGAQQTRLP